MALTQTLAKTPTCLSRAIGSGHRRSLPYQRRTPQGTGPAGSRIRASSSSTWDQRSNDHPSPCFGRRPASACLKDASILGLVQRGSLSSSPLSWADLVGRDGIEPPTLRFSAARSTD